MSDTSLTIPKVPKLENSENYEFLRQAGIQYIQKLSGRIWTDYNRHDPGISIHELMCYAITDLGYRTSFSIPDLLAVDKHSTGPVENPADFFTAAEILPVNPTSEIDIRKLIIDTPGVRNAWIITAKDSEYPVYFDHTRCELTIDPAKGDKLIPLQGLYNVLLEYEKDDKDKEFYDAINAEVRAAIMAHRNLCEDLLSITAVGYEDIAVCADIEVKQYADIDVVQAKIYKILIDYFTPSANFYTLEEMLEGEADKKELLTGGVLSWKRAPKNIDQIFEGPLLKHGFIDDDELAKADLRTELHVSDVINSIMDIDGVIAVKTISFLKYLDGVVTDVQDWVMPLGKLLAPRLSRDKSKFIFYKGILPYMANKESVDHELRELQQKNEAFRKTGHTRDLVVPEGEFRSLSDYYPVQNDFPLVYGIGEIGLSGSVNDKRQAQAKQLKAYLLLFEQILADYLAQLANLKKLFSADQSVAKAPNKTFSYDSEKSRTYFTNKLREIRMFQEKEVIVRLLTSTNRDEREASRNELIDLFDYKYFILIEWMTETDSTRIAAWLLKLKVFFAHGEYDFTALHTLRTADPAAFALKRTELIKTIYDDVNDTLTGVNYDKALNEISENAGIFIDRRNRFMDHLMARFCEQMTDYSLLVHQMTNDEEQSGLHMVYDKERFLSDYPVFSRDRGKGFNYKYPHQPSTVADKGTWNTENVAGMKHRIVRLLGMDDYKRRTLATELLTIKITVVSGEPTWHVELIDPLQHTVVLMNSLDYDTEECAESTLLYMLHQGDNEDKYEIKGSAGSFYYVLNNDCEDVEAVATSAKKTFLTREACNTEMQRVIQFFRDHCDVENFHLVEHILLRPRTNLDIPLPGCTSCTTTGKRPVATENIPEYLFHIRLLTQDERDKSPMHARQKRKDRWKFELQDRNGRIILNSEGYVELNSCTNGIASLRAHGINKLNYHLSKSKTFNGFSLFADNGQLIAKSRNYKDIKNRDEEINRLMVFFAFKDDVWNVEEGKEEEFFCGEDDDPYSFQLSVVLPAWPTRFRNIAFRQFVEKTIRLETPAHIHPKICWVNLDQMRRFERAYRKWVGGMVNSNFPNPHTSRQLIKALYDLDNVYPAALLHSCDDTSSNEPQVILDFTSLGNL